MADDEESAALSDVDEEEIRAPGPPPPVIPSASSLQQLIQNLQSELEEERRRRRSAEEAKAEADTRHSRIKAFAQDGIKKRDDAFRQRDEALSQRDEAVRQREEAVSQREEALRLKNEAVAQRDDALRIRTETLTQYESLQAEIGTLTQMLTNGMEKISGKISVYKTFSPDGLPKSQKYSGLQAVAYGVIKRANEIVEEMLKQIDLVSKSRDQARESVEQRNYEIAIEVSELEAKISELRDEVSKKESENQNLAGSVGKMETEISELRNFREECDNKARSLEAKLDAQRPILLEQVNYISKLHEEIQETVKIVYSDGSDELEASSSVFMSGEIDVNDNLKGLLQGVKSVYKFAELAREKVLERMEERNGEVKSLEEKINALIEEKKHIGTLLRSMLLSNKSEILQVAKDGLKEAGIELNLDGNRKIDLENEDLNQDEVYSLAGALENTVKESQIKIIELQHLVEALRAESSLYKARVDSQLKEISQLKAQLKEIEERERLANESIEGLMMDITAAEEEIARWKIAAEQEANAGKSIEQEFQEKMVSLKKELEETIQSTQELENKLKFKEETAQAAMAAREAAENSLRLADIRSTRLRQRLEELSRQIEQTESGRNNNHLINRSGNNDYRYACWPWQWLGLNIVGHGIVEGNNERNSNNELELEEPLL
ncbi:hypothetical protein LUZ60_015683 [Juncus effusus]|nr:hypothetical protein LUZ60_015683 [Juncus effusus]